ncbi:MAG: hypothetical protein IH872_11585 [Chloroflexi bacterium]|nr:hypothetical protein [Chloroflexota bacterium]
MGVFAGSVKIGPLCPVDPCFQAAGDTYSSRQLQLQSKTGEEILVQLRPDGTFLTFVPVGEYSVTLTGCDFLGCSGSLPVTVVINEGEATDVIIDIDTGIRPPTVPPSASHTRLAEDLRAAGAEVEIGPSGRSSVLDVPIRNFAVNDALVHVWEFPSEDEAEAGADTVGPDGFSVGRAFVDWTDSPHFYSSGTLIVLYVGNDVEILTLLEGIVGRQFAGSATITPGQLDPRGSASRTAFRELSARLGVAPDDLRLVHSRLVVFNDGGMGCSDAGGFYTQAIIPGYVLLYEADGVRYPFHVDTDGQSFTDCRRENNVAVPFRVADGFVRVRDAFELDGGGPSNLGKDIVLTTRAEAAAYIADSNGLVEMDLDSVDWETEMLVGTVITGSGCSFEVVTPLVLMRHLAKTVDVHVEAEQTGLCEKAWAQPVWLVLQEVPKDYSAGFILTYSMN